jgi:hypothetical protein
MRYAAVLLLLIAIGCATPVDPPSSSTMEPEIASLVASAERLTTIKGPWRVEEIRKGPFGELWRGSTNDLSGQAPGALRAKADLVVWRVILSGPTGLQELYIDSSRENLVDSITQGE